MVKKKVKIFLAGFINYPNAQNLNCLALSKHLNPSIFEIYTLTTYHAEKIKTDTTIFHCFYPFRFSSLIGFIWGILKCDIIYFPKHRSISSWIFVLASFFGKKIFTTIENNICDLNKESILNSFGGKKPLVKYFKNIPNIYGITRFIIDNATCGVNLKNEVLYLGVENDNFVSKKRSKLKNVVFVGNIKKRKRVDEIIKLASKFSEINFNIIGDGIERKKLQSISGSNVFFYGHLNQNELASQLEKMDLLFLPSRSEGFPKVILEAAAAGIPSLVYSDYGANEWIVSGENGFIINSFEDSIDLINLLKHDSNLLARASKGAILLANKFDWKKVVLKWEKIILSLR